MTKTKTMTKTNTFRKHPQRAILETCDLCDIWSEWWGDMTWPKKRQWQRQRLRQRQRQWQWQRQSQWLVTIETLITILKIENLDSWQSLLPDNYEWHWTAFAILAMFNWIEWWTLSGLHWVNPAKLLFCFWVLFAVFVFVDIFVFLQKSEGRAAEFSLAARLNSGHCAHSHT